MSNEPLDDFRKMVIEETLGGTSLGKSLRDKKPLNEEKDPRGAGKEVSKVPPTEVVGGSCTDMLSKTLHKRNELKESEEQKDNEVREDVLSHLKGNESKVRGLLEKLL